MKEMIEFMEELEELCHKGKQIMQKMQGENFGQRRYHYGMRDSQGSYGGGYGSGGGYGQRWDEYPQMQGGYPPMQGGYHNPQRPDINPMMFM